MPKPTFKRIIKTLCCLVKYCIGRLIIGKLFTLVHPKGLLERRGQKECTIF